MIYDGESIPHLCGRWVPPIFVIQAGRTGVGAHYARDNREAVKRDNNNIFDFLESEGYIRLKADASISSKELYEVYRMWCEENSLTPLKSRSFSDGMIASQERYNLEHCNKITNAAGRRVWGFMGIEAIARPDVNGFFSISPCTYVPEDWRD